MRLAACRSMTNHESFRDLKVWQRSMTLVEEIYQASKRFPRDERFGLTAQIRRACISIVEHWRRKASQTPARVPASSRHRAGVVGRGRSPARDRRAPRIPAASRIQPNTTDHRGSRSNVERTDRLDAAGTPPTSIEASNALPASGYRPPAIGYQLAGHNPSSAESRCCDNEPDCRGPAVRWDHPPCRACTAAGSCDASVPRTRCVVHDDAIVKDGDDRGLCECPSAAKPGAVKMMLYACHSPGGREAFTSGGY